MFSGFYKERIIINLSNKKFPFMSKSYLNGSNQNYEWIKKNLKIKKKNYIINEWNR